MKIIKTPLLLLFCLGIYFVGFSQENVEPDEIAVVDDAFENNFYEALTQKAIENYDKAIVSLQKCLDKEPKNPILYHELGKNYFLLKQYADAENSFNKAIELNPNERWYWNGLYDVYYEIKDYNNAIRAVTKLIEFNKDFQDDLVSLYMYTNQKDKALSLLKEMQKTTNLSKTMEFYLLKLEQSEPAPNPDKKDLEAAIKKNPLIEQNYIDLIYQYSEANNEEKAFEVAKKLAENIPNSDWAHVSLVKFHLNNNDGQSASESVFKVLGSKKIDSKIKHRVFNEFLIFSANHPEFTSDLDKAINYFDDDKQINVSKEVAKFFLKRNRKEEGMKYFEKSIENKPDDLEAYSYLMPLLIDNNEFQKVEKLANSQLELYPTQANLYYYCGLALNNLGKFKEAKNKLEEGIDFIIEDEQLEQNFYKQILIAFEKLGDSKNRQKYQSKIKQ
ncbi:tetratricopeptide repeat protein [Flavobacterium sp.]|uniref:tetratricopeptide repeat protein n=1 Tax=Flavobacterium sp. TaxID=239 RepID=UPI003F69B379